MSDPVSTDGARDAVRVVVRDGDREYVLRTTPGTNLRRLLLAHDLSPYTRLTRRANCGGRGLCATCGVRIRDGPPEATHWHDRLADWAGYPRLSCQVTVEADTTVELVDKLVWGRRESVESETHD